MRFLNTILDIIFPAKCISCNQAGVDLCINCLSDSPLAERETAKWIFALYDYRHPPVKKALWFLKYKGKKRLANIFAEVLYDKISEELADLSLMENFNNVILIPIPLSARRYRERGYNQAELICKELIRLSKTNHLTPPPAPLSLSRRGAGSEVFSLRNDILIKPKETEHQARIESRSQRLKNIVGSFAVKNAEKVKNRNIILIDDITTTGATLNEATTIL
ncbi:MAG: hypothetical protein NTZ87_01815 [Candidatus Nomurabacteria bacterium]|nr:hypothetical protein [Candidatus Nomurabacteria bacterium]